MWSWATVRAQHAPTHWAALSVDTNSHTAAAQPPGVGRLLLTGKGDAHLGDGRGEQRAWLDLKLPRDGLGVSEGGGGKESLWSRARLVRCKSPRLLSYGRVGDTGSTVGPLAVLGLSPASLCETPTASTISLCTEGRESESSAHQQRGRADERVASLDHWSGSCGG